MFDWLLNNPTLAWWLLGLSVAMTLAGLAAVPLILVRMPADFFVRERPSRTTFSGRHPAIRWTVRIAKNLIGGLLLLAGLVMLFTPGQGLLAIVLGLSLLDLPGKRELQLRIVRQPEVLQAINRLRAKWGRQHLVTEAT